MNDKNRAYRRRNYYINRKFQTDFAVRFLALIVIAASSVLGLFLYNSKGTLTAGYSGSEVKLLRTMDFFLPALIPSAAGAVIVTGIIGIVVLIFISHRIAGPIFRFQKALNEIGKGDLTHRITLRKDDQFTELADRINELAGTMDGRIGNIKARAGEISRLVAELRTVSASHPSLAGEIERPLDEITGRLSELQDAANHFKTSHHE